LGFDAHGLLFAKKVRDEGGDFGLTATIGRQGLYVPVEVMQNLLNPDLDYKLGDYCEQVLINFFGSSAVHSFDNSDYENATYMHDFNEPLPENHHGKYDTVIDAGSLEHIYDVRTAVENFEKMLRPGGRIIHINPANNFCGHGFYQFSPEFFYSTYSSDSGFANTEVYIARISNLRHWFKVKKPTDGKRVEISSTLPIVNLVWSQKVDDARLEPSIQQSDYLHLWRAELEGSLSSIDRSTGVIRRILRKSPALSRMAMRVYFRLQQSALLQMLTVTRKLDVNSRNRWLTKIPIRLR
jgi:hypothetical protein